MGRRNDIRPLPPLERLNEMFSYDQESGALIWKTVPDKFRRAKTGDVAGTVSRCGYRVVGVDRKQYLEHRVIWKIMTGEDPVDQIDHVDGNKRNNAWRNLRSASNGENRWNTRIAKNNTSGVKGVCWDETRNVWVAYIGKDSRQSRLGRFKNLEDAKYARSRAVAAMHGEFARTA